MGRKNNQVLILFLCLLASCVKDTPPAKSTAVPTDKSGVYVVCEGQFTAGNSSLYLYKPTLDSVYGDLYLNTNGQQMGDVFQSMLALDSRYFLVVNNSDKVVAIDAGLKTLGNIPIPSPRYILPVSSTKAYVSSLYRNKVYVVNTTSLTVTDSILLPATNTEGMCLHDGSAYICVWDTTCNKLYQVDAATNRITQAIPIGGYAPHNVLVDKEQMLWVLSGNEPMHRQAYWTRIDPSTGSILAMYQFPVSAEPIKPVFNDTKDTLYFIEANYYGGTTDNGVYRMGIHDAALPAVPFVAAKRFQYFWAVGVDPLTGYVYVGDPKGFNQNGSVSIYKQDGALMKTFATGIGPGMFLFVN